MAKAKKEAALTPEERLQAALVPDWEWPYKLPENWCWTYLGQISEILNGYAFKSQQYCGTGIRIIRITNVQDGYIEDEKPVFYPIEFTQKLEQFLLNEGDLLMSLTGNVGRVAILTRDYLPAALNQRVGCIRTQNDYVIKKYLFYYFLQKKFQDSCVKNAKGSAQLNMSTEWLKIQEIALPPLAEQQRIVDRIESLFAKLDEAKEKAQAVVDSFETRKAAILHKAFAGELTANWREEHGVGMESWKTVTIQDVAALLNGDRGENYPSKSEYVSTGIPFIHAGALKGGFVDLSEVYHITKEKFDSLRAGKVQKGDVLYCLRGSLGKNAIINDKLVGAIASSLCILRPTDLITSAFLFFLVNSDIVLEQQRAEDNGSAQPNLSAKSVKNYSVPLPLLDEQKKIVLILENTLMQEHQAKEAAEAVIDQIDLMKKSILARAFRGELGTNDPADEPAVELLKKILNEE